VKPTLLILAAGMGSRYGSMKQTESFGPNGETITDYSIYDAMRSGFGKVVFVISPAMEEEFRTDYIRKFPKSITIEYVIQSIQNIPAGISINPERKKPWGTAHAVLMAKDAVREPFAVINADDFYGRGSYKLVADYLINTKEDKLAEFCMAGYPVNNTLSEHGTVSRGVCEINSGGYLTDIRERTKIQRKGSEIVNIEEQGGEILIPGNALVSMNMFGFTPRLFQYLERYFNEFIRANSMDAKAEIYLPIVVQRMIEENVGRTRVLRTDETWFGVTYREDRPKVLEMISGLINKGLYPTPLWEK
jgi:dTDP-glucose pyrophosphorylase